MQTCLTCCPSSYKRDKTDKVALKVIEREKLRGWRIGYEGPSVILSILREKGERDKKGGGRERNWYSPSLYMYQISHSQFPQTKDHHGFKGKRIQTATNSSVSNRARYLRLANTAHATGCVNELDLWPWLYAVWGVSLESAGQAESIVFSLDCSLFQTTWQNAEVSRCFHIYFCFFPLRIKKKKRRKKTNFPLSPHIPYLMFYNPCRERTALRSLEL